MCSLSDSNMIWTQNHLGHKHYSRSSLVLLNVSRPGVKRKMMSSQFRNEKLNENRMYIVLVMDHRTAKKSGSAAIVFTWQ